MSETHVSSASLYKATSNSEIVVPRSFSLDKDQGMLSTSKQYDESADRKQWFLARNCELIPKTASEVSQPVKKLIRPRGTWTITATALGGCESIELYMIQVVWPTSWARKGYTSLVIGSTTQEEAQIWHGHISQALEILKARHHKRSLSKPSIHSVEQRKLSETGEQRKPSENGSVTAPTSKEQVADVARTSSAKEMDKEMSFNNLASAQGLPPKSHKSRHTRHPSSDAAFQFIQNSSGYEAAGVRTGVCGPAQVQKGAGSGLVVGGDSSDDEDEGRFHEASALGPPQPISYDRWVPYKQTNGVAIYHLEDPEAKKHLSSEVGGEFMVAASVRGTPAEVLDVLLGGSSNTTILGPASLVETLQSSSAEDTRKETVRLILEAPGWAGRFCAPREMLVERLMKKDEGMYVVLFSSVEEPEEPKEGLSSPNSKKSETGRKIRSLYHKPVRGAVRGTYCIAPLQGQDLESSRECLIRCIIKVDLKGSCGDKAWARPLTDLLGWTDAFLDRILMTVILVRDEVEHSRFRGGRLPMPSSPSPLDPQSDKEVHMEQEQQPIGRMQSKRPSSALDLRLRSLSALCQPSTSKAAPSPRVATIHENDSSAEAGGLEAKLSVGSDLSAPSEETLDWEKIRGLCTLKYGQQNGCWSEIHAPGGTPCPFVVRGPTYLKDKKKIPAGLTAFTFGAMDVVNYPKGFDGQHVSRFLPSIRESRAPFAVVINLIIPGVPLLGIVATFMTDKHPDILGEPPKNPMEEDHDWQPFDFVLHKFLHSDNATRNLMLKLIPHIADGSWIIKSSVGTTPVITGKALKTTYHVTKQYIEVAIDVSANATAAYVTSLVRSATKSLVIDMGFVLEGKTPWELPEALMGCLRLNFLDIKEAKMLDVTNEIPLLPPIQGPKPLVRTMSRGHSRNPSLADGNVQSSPKGK